LRGGEVWRLPLLPAELARQDSVKKRRQTEVTSDRVRSVAATIKRRSLGFCTGASGQAPRGTAEREGLIRHGGASGQS
jgi:hypothetical protein